MCRELTQRPNLPLVTNVSYGWVCRILTCTSGGRFRDLHKRTRIYMIDDRVVNNRCSKCKDEHTTHTVLFDGGLVRLPKLIDDCNLYITVLDALLPFNRMCQSPDQRLVLITTSISVNANGMGSPIKIYIGDVYTQMFQSTFATRRSKNPKNWDNFSMRFVGRNKHNIPDTPIGV